MPFIAQFPFHRARGLKILRALSVQESFPLNRTAEFRPRSLLKHTWYGLLGTAAETLSTRHDAMTLQLTQEQHAWDSTLMASIGAVLELLLLEVMLLLQLRNRARTSTIKGKTTPGRPVCIWKYSPHERPPRARRRKGKRGSPVHLPLGNLYARARNRRIMPPSSRGSYGQSYPSPLSLTCCEL